jgi:transcription initiation factor TFIIIB Brf1 subunit/transcription initiation factor TFIIB
MSTRLSRTETKKSPILDLRQRKLVSSNHYFIRNIKMNLTPEATEAVQSELKRFATDLNLSEDQKTRMKSALENAREKLDEVRKNNPDITKADVIAKLKAARDPVRGRVEAFLTPEQLTKWDAEVAKAKTFLGYAS